MEAEEAVNPTTLNGVPIVDVSAQTGEGLDELVNVIENRLAKIPPKKESGRPRLPVDRVFTIAGSGTVVTGTLIDGSLFVGQEVEIVPSGIKSRLRGLQTHKARIEKAVSGSRVAANLTGVTTSQIQRGDVITKPGWLKPTGLVTVKLRMLPYLSHSLRHGVTVSFHTGSAETMAKTRLLDADNLTPGGITWVQFSLENPVAVVKGDHFIVRSPDETLGGGKIVDVHAKRLRRFRPDVIKNLDAAEEGTGEDAVVAMLDSKKTLEIPALVSQLGMTEDEVRQLLESVIEDGRVIQLGEGGQGLLMTISNWENLAGKVRDILKDYHRKFPIRPGMPRAEVVSRLKLGAYASAALQKMLAQGEIAVDGGTVRLSVHEVSLSSEQQTKIKNFLEKLAQNPYSPPGELIPEPDVLNLLIEQRKVVKVSDTVVFSASAYDDMVKRVVSHIEANGKITLAEMRDLFQTSRKYVQALAEYLDGNKITRRVGDERVLY